jgi:uncharacterized protein (TIGR02996 family)
LSHDLPALLRSVLDDPEDLATRRVYGDALIAAGGPRGELIAVQCDLDTAAPSDPRWRELLAREQELLSKHGKSWVAPFKSFLLKPTFERGMIESAFVSSKKFVPAAGTLLEREPVTSLGMRALTQADATLLATRSELARLRSLRITESKLGAPAIKALFGAHMVKLRALRLYQSGLDDDGLAHLGTTVFPQLERLDISGTRVTYRGLARLLGDPRLARLGYLSLLWLEPGADGAAHLAEHLDLPALTHLDLGSSHYQNGDLRMLARNATFRKLRGLRLEANQLAGAGAIEALSGVSELEVLDLSTNPIGLDGVTALAATTLPLRVLRLYQCGIRDEHLVALASARFPLRRLDLGYGAVRAAGLEAIGRTAWPLEILELWANKIGDDGARALASASFTRTLRELVLGYNEIGDAGAAALAAGHWPRLERIVFRGDPIGEAGARALAESSTMPALRSIQFQDMSVPRSALAPARKRGVRIEM